MLYSKAPEFSTFRNWVPCLPPRVPELPCSSAARACHLPPATPERLQLCFPRPRVVLSSLPPPVSFPLSSPRCATLGCRSRAAATHQGSPTPLAIVGSVRDHSLLLSPSFLPVESCLPYKTKLSSILLLFLPLFLLPATTSTEAPPHSFRQNPPQPHHAAQIPLAQSFLTSSPCSTA
jgi:hypothetical protein